MELPIDIIIRVDAKKENNSGESTFQCKALGELVRCKDCKYYKIAQLTKDYEPDRRCKPSCCTKDEFAIHRKPDWFCADGKRRENAVGLCKKYKKAEWKTETTIDEHNINAL